MSNAKNKYGNLALWTQDEWENIDIHLFILANFTRYSAQLIKRVGQRHLPSDTADSLPGLFCDVAWKPLKTVHARNIDAEGERRNQIMLGTLKMITFTRMVDALIREFPNHIAIDQLPEFAEDNDADTDHDGEHPAQQMPGNEPDISRRALFAAEDHAFLHELQEQEDSVESERISTMLEQMRSALTPVQFRHLRHTICDRMDANEIAELTGHSVTNARIILLKTRKRMIELVPQEMVDSVTDCILRR